MNRQLEAVKNVERIKLFPPRPAAGRKKCRLGLGGSATCNAKRFRGGLVFKAYRLVYHSNSRVESHKEEEERMSNLDADAPSPPDAAAWSSCGCASRGYITRHNTPAQLRG